MWKNGLGEPKFKPASNFKRVMAYQVAKSVPLSSPALAPHAISWSVANNIACVSLDGIRIYDFTSRVDQKEGFQFIKNSIPNWTEPNPALNIGISRTTINAKIPFLQISDFVLDRSLSTVRFSDQPVVTGFRLVSWSPAGLGAAPRTCVLAALTADYRLLLYSWTLEQWRKFSEPSSLLAGKLNEENFSRLPEEEIPLSSLVEEAKSRAHRVSTICVAWSLIHSEETENWALLFGLQRSGHLAVWRVSSSGNVTVAGELNLGVEHPTSFCVQQTSDRKFLLVTGTFSGTVKIAELELGSLLELKLTEIGYISADPDFLAVSKLDVIPVTDSYVIVAAKNNILCFTSFSPGRLNEGFETCHQFDGLQITGFSWGEDGSFICSTDDGQVFQGRVGFTNYNEIELIDLKSLGTSSVHVSLKGVCYSPHNINAFCQLETLKILYDQSKCKQVSFLVIQTVNSIDSVVETLKSGNNMRESSAMLEAYKSLSDFGDLNAMWDSDMNQLSDKSNYQLQLLRWISLYHSKTTSNKDIKDGLNARAQLLEYCLRLRHTSSLFHDVLQKDEQLTADQLLSLYLSTEFASVTLSTDLTAEFRFSDLCPADLIQEIRQKLGEKIVEETCTVCGESVPFEKVESGQCSRKHAAPRCVASLRLCFSKTKRCLFCSAFYRKDYVFGDISECLLCGGPLQ